MLQRRISSHLWNINGKIVTLYGYVCRWLVRCQQLDDANHHPVLQPLLIWIPRRHKSTQRFPAWLTYKKDEPGGRRKVNPVRTNRKKSKAGEAGGDMSPCIASCSQGHIRILRGSDGIRRWHETMSDIKFCLFVIHKSIYSSGNSYCCHVWTHSVTSSTLLIYDSLIHTHRSCRSPLSLGPLRKIKRMC